MNLSRRDWCAAAGAIRLLALPCLLFLLQVACTTLAQTAPNQRHLQGFWEGDGPPGRISLTITGSSLHFYVRTDFWYEATFTLPAGTAPQQLTATITGSSPPTTNIGDVVFAIVKIEDGTLSLAVDDGSDAAPTSFAEAMSRYDLKRVGRQERNAGVLTSRKSAAQP